MFAPFGPTCGGERPYAAAPAYPSGHSSPDGCVTRATVVRCAQSEYSCCSRSPENVINGVINPDGALRRGRSRGRCRGARCQVVITVRPGERPVLWSRRTPSGSTGTMSQILVASRVADFVNVIWVQADYRQHIQCCVWRVVNCQKDRSDADDAPSRSRFGAAGPSQRAHDKYAGLVLHPSLLEAGPGAEGARRNEPVRGDPSPVHPFLCSVAGCCRSNDDSCVGGPRGRYGQLHFVRVDETVVSRLPLLGLHRIAAPPIPEHPPSRSGPLARS